MAGLAIGRRVAVVDAVVNWKSVLVQAGGGPGRGGVTIITLSAKGAGMNLWLRMALSTFARCAGKTRQTVRIGVAALALDFCMPAVEDEDLRVAESTQPVNPIMARQAVTAELRLVILHKDRVGCRMTINAGVQVSAFLWAADVAVQAVDRVPLVIDSMERQAKGGRGGMIEGLSIELRRLPALGSMAGSAVL
jgi:hypothetical protein